MSKKKKKTFIARIPLPVRGGIHVQSPKPRASRKWWAAKWMDFMEELHMGARLGRGRSYAISGQVFQLDVSPGLVAASVQGGKSEPYHVKLQFEVIPSDVKAKLVAKLRARPLILAQMLVHNLPRSVDVMFRATGYPLVPSVANSFVASCDCPDYANPCKHIAAILILLTEAFESDPLRLLTLRGISREDLLGKDEHAPGTPSSSPISATDALYDGAFSAADSEQPQPCAGNHALSGTMPFWGRASDMKADLGPAPVGSRKSPLISRLGGIPFWRGEQRFSEAMEQCSERYPSEGLRIRASIMPRRDTTPRVENQVVTRKERIRATGFDEM